MNKELEMVRLACKAMDEKKAIDIKVIDIHEVSVIADYFVIASGSNLNQVQAKARYEAERKKENEKRRKAAPCPIRLFYRKS